MVTAMTHPFHMLIAELARNQSLPESPGRDARRLFHGRGQCFPGLEHINVDFYPPVIVIQLFAPEPGIQTLIQQISQVFPVNSCILVQERFKDGQLWRLARGELPTHTLAWENGQAYQLQFMKNQNVGFFLDMRMGRELVKSLAKGKRVLNLFSYTCSLSVAAMSGGAQCVWNVDMAKSALRVGRDNHVRNKLDVRDVHFLPNNILKSFGKIRKNGPYDLVIIDPPTYQKSGFLAERDYARVVRRLPEFLAPSATVLACLNAPNLNADFLEKLFSSPSYSLIQKLGRPPEFPEKEADASLKIHQYHYLNPHPNVLQNTEADV